MILVTYKDKHVQHLGLYINNKVYNYDEAAKACGVKKNAIKTMKDFLTLWQFGVKEFQEVHDKIKSEEVVIPGFEWEELEIIAPVPHPTSCRDAYAFRQHVAAARRNRNVEMIAEFD